MTIRLYDREKDRAATQRIWLEVAWIEDDEQARANMSDFVEAGPTYVAELNGEAECLAAAMMGDLRHLDSTLPFSAITAVTNSRIARKQGFASRTTAQVIAHTAVVEGALLSGLGIFEQGFYDRLGFGGMHYELDHAFDPAMLAVNRPFRVPRRLSQADAEAIHAARLQRQRGHGSVNIFPLAMTAGEMGFEKNLVMLGYADGPAGELTHFFAASGGDKEHGPYRMWLVNYQTAEQFLELMALLKSLGDQIHLVKMTEPPGIQLQDLIARPFAQQRITRKSNYEQGMSGAAWQQVRINDLTAVVNQTRLPGSDSVRFNLHLSDPISRYLPEDAPWRGTAGQYIVTLGAESHAETGHSADLPTLTATVNAFTRLWLGARSATGLAVTDTLHGPESLLRDLDWVLRLPLPRLDWPF
ncbi:MAG: hypothetical protein KDD89_11965 [Anaerolineales bacterium]|nr:hypothetical protein [Anaerolineales bacterium]